MGSKGTGEAMDQQKTSPPMADTPRINGFAATLERHGRWVLSGDGYHITFDEPSASSSDWYVNIWLRGFRVGYVIATSLSDCESRTSKELSTIKRIASELPT